MNCEPHMGRSAAEIPPLWLMAYPDSFSQAPRTLASHHLCCPISEFTCLLPLQILKPARLTPHWGLQKRPTWCVELQNTSTLQGFCPILKCPPTVRNSALALTHKVATTKEGPSPFTNYLEGGSSVMSMSPSLYFCSPSLCQSIACS